MGARPRKCDEEETFLFHDVCVGCTNITFDHALGRWTALAGKRRWEACFSEAWNVHRLEFEPLAAVDRHQTDRVHMQGACGNLTKVAFLGKKHELAHAIERARDRSPGGNRAAIAYKVQELPYRDCLHLVADALSPGGLRKQVGAVEQVN